MMRFIRIPFQAIEPSSCEQAALLPGRANALAAVGVNFERSAAIPGRATAWGREPGILADQSRLRARSQIRITLAGQSPRH
jgi:hypothetical protein